MNQNPLVLARDSAQHVRWAHFKQDTQYELTFLQPLRGVTQNTGQHNTPYLILCAVIEKDALLLNTTLTKTHCILLDVPQQTFMTAWLSLPWPLRKEISEDDSVRVVMCKHGKASIMLSSCRIITTTKEEELFAAEQYALLQRLTIKNDVVHDRHETVVMEAEIV